MILRRKEENKTGRSFKSFISSTTIKVVCDFHEKIEDEPALYVLNFYNENDQRFFYESKSGFKYSKIKKNDLFSPNLGFSLGERVRFESDNPFSLFIKAFRSLGDQRLFYITNTKGDEHVTVESVDLPKFEFDLTRDWAYKQFNQTPEQEINTTPLIRRTPRAG